MARPLKTGKQAIDLAAKAAPGSLIRREPPPVVKQTVVPDRDEVDRRAAAIGIAVFAIAILVILFGLSSWAGWTPTEYTIRIEGAA